jgi:hypothetical protein
MAVKNREKVLERLATTEKTTTAFEIQPDGKMRVRSRSSDGEKVFSKGQVLEMRNVVGRLHVSRKERRPDEWDPPVEPCDLYAPGASHDFDVIT